MYKSTKILSEIRSFFVEKRQYQLLTILTVVVDSLNLDSRSLGGNKFHLLGMAKMGNTSRSGEK